jgi:hypothetical protein
MSTTIDCFSRDWKTQLMAVLKSGKEAQLINFRFPFDGIFAETLATAYGMEFHSDCAKRTGSFKKPVHQAR